jgi:hypothetical protein
MRDMKTRKGIGRSPSFFGMPQSRLGWCSTSCAIVFPVLFSLWYWYAVYLRPIRRPTFFSDPLHAFLMLAAIMVAVTAAIVGALAIIAKHERSFAIFVSVVLGTSVLCYTICVIVAG